MLLKIYVASSLDNYKERQLVMNSFYSEFKSEDWMLPIIVVQRQLSLELFF